MWRNSRRTGPRLVLVETGSGAERPGPSPRPADLAWSRTWWPLHEPGDRAELGRTRCQAWAGVVRRITRGLAVAADYGHLRADRPAGHPHRVPGRAGGARHPGRVTRHHGPRRPRRVRGRRAGGGRDRGRAHHAAPGPPRAGRDRPPAAAGAGGDDPLGYARALCQASEEAELIDPDGLGGIRLAGPGRGPGPPGIAGALRRSRLRCWTVSGLIARIFATEIPPNRAWPRRSREAAWRRELWRVGA